jgi:hypothetical protein
MLPSASIALEKIAAFSKIMSDLLDNGEMSAREAYLRTPIVGENPRQQGSRQNSHSRQRGPTRMFVVWTGMARSERFELPTLRFEV